MHIIRKSTNTINDNKIVKGKGECVKEITFPPKSIKQPKVTNGSSMQRETSAPGCALQMAPK